MMGSLKLNGILESLLSPIHILRLHFLKEVKVP
ncbi:hypothetical protein Pan153_04020 [Gimesia panareensis]|uniref:Uncharacterized protein n=1 Tax=Gimesia panareensis TaxID=2527978 RepID=A0A518FHG4_9PLAN|nr:hypothetical protein Pan153_04020 [Gimesia panareensis]